MQLTAEEKWCSSCEKIKLHEEFNKDKQKKDGLRNYCKDCEKIQYQEKKHKKEMGQIEDVIVDIIDLEPSQKTEVVKKEIKADVETLARIVVKEHGEDRKQADEVYNLMMQKVITGDNSQATKEAITKSLELKMNSNDSLVKLIQVAAKIQEAREKSKGSSSSGINVANLKDKFKLKD